MDTAEYALTTDTITNTGNGNPGKVGYMPADRSTFKDAMRDYPAGWKASIREEQLPPMDHEVFPWVTQPPDPKNKILPSSFLYPRKFDKEENLTQLKLRVDV